MSVLIARRRSSVSPLISARSGALAAALVCLFAASAAILPTSSAAAKIRFSSCANPAQKQFQCGSLKVPVDYSGRVRGTIKLRVLRTAPVAGRGTLVALAGGPGQSATSVAPAFASALAGASSRYNLVIFDQRGTGESGDLRCTSLENATSPSAIATGAKSCGKSLGSRISFYTTAQSVRDIDRVRDAVGARKLFLAGISYGTFVATQYARTFPRRTERLLLDSVMGSRGWDPLLLPSVRAVPRIVGAQCSGGACAAVPGDTLKQLGDAVARLASAPLRGKTVFSDGNPVDVTVRDHDVQAAFFSGDLRSGLRSLLPGAVASYLAGDGAPLRRLVVLNLTSRTGSAGGKRWAQPLPTAGTTRHSNDLQRARIAAATRELSSTLNIVTSCSDARLPWGSRDSTLRREGALTRVTLRLGDKQVYPFTRSSTLYNSIAAQCFGWPETSLRGAVTTRRLPNVPTLLIDGLEDMRTPLEQAQSVARELPNNQLVSVPHFGHSPLSSLGCAQRAVGTWLDGGDARNSCADNHELIGVQEAPPRSLGAVAPVSGIASDTVARAVGAAVDTERDALVTVLAADPSSDKITLGGLRSGRYRYEFKTGSVAATFERVEFVPGVVVSGAVERDSLGSTPFSGSLELSGPAGASGSVEFSRTSVSGTINGQTFSVPRPTQ